MTLAEFLAIYRFGIREYNLENHNYVIITEVFRREGNVRVSGMKDSLDINELNDWLAYPGNPIDWPALIDKYKRGQLDFYARRVPIIDFFPLADATDITNLG